MDSPADNCQQLTTDHWQLTTSSVVSVSKDVLAGVGDRGRQRRMDLGQAEQFESVVEH